MGILTVLFFWGNPEGIVALSASAALFTHPNTWVLVVWCRKGGSRLFVMNPTLEEVFFSHLNTTGEFHMLNDTPFFGLKIFCHGIGGNQVGEDAGLHSLAKSVEQESSSVVPGLRKSVEVVVLETNRSCLKRKGKGRIHSLMPYGFFSLFFFGFGRFWETIAEKSERWVKPWGAKPPRREESRT